MPTVALATLGCRLNQADSALMAAALNQAGYTVVPWGEPADVLIVNSCAVTGTASSKTRHLLRTARRTAPDALLVLTGCEANLAAAGGLAGELADLVMANPKPDNIAAALAAYRQGESLPPVLPLDDDFVVAGTGWFHERTRANLKIQEGCDFHCSYCIVPTTRGAARSRLWSDVLREAGELLAAGYRELVLTGVNIATYDSGGLDLTGLIAKLLTLGDGFRIRLGSTEPGAGLERLADLMAADSRLCRFLHLPVQYGADRVLGLMRRRYSCAGFARSATYALDKVPNLCLGTDVIVGFPGETAADFAECRRFIESLYFSLLHVFPYSPRPGTPAASWPGRPPKEIVDERVRDLLALAQRRAAAYADRQIGSRLTVLVEELEPQPSGWSDNYLRVRITSPRPLNVNTFADVRITAAHEKRGLTGELSDTP